MNTAQLIAIAILAAPVSSHETIRVPGDASTVQEGIDLAVDGDRVLVAPGIYPEVINFQGKAIRVLGIAGPSVTVLDGSGLSEPVVKFHSGEGPESCLGGFTVRGGQTFLMPGGGISCMELPVGTPVARPTIQHCIVEGNRADAGFGGGIAGDATISRCIVRNNVASGGCGGGVFGAPRMQACRIEGNVASDAGGIYVGGSGARIDRCAIVGNTAFDGGRGGGIGLGSGVIGSSDALITRCVIAGNSSDAGQATAQGGGVHASRLGSANTRIDRCTIAFNRVFDGPGEDVGGVFGPAQVVNSIVWGNEQEQFGAATAFSWSDVQGGAAGTGNIDLDPLFRDAAQGDFRLMGQSPCIDSGDPASSLDPDCTRADQGALPFPQANAIVRNGTGINSLCLSSASLPELGGTWTAVVDTADGSSHGLRLAVLFFSLQPIEGRVLPAGELLIDPRSIVRTLIRIGPPGQQQFHLPLPDNEDLAGLSLHVQALILGGPARARLCNALELKLGLPR